MHLYRTNFPDIDNDENKSSKASTYLVEDKYIIPSDENHTIGYETCLIVY